MAKEKGEAPLASPSAQRALVTLAKVVLSWVPSPDITVTAATAISAAIIAYSRAVTAFVSALNDATVLQTACMIFPQLVDGGVCLKPAFKNVTRSSGNRCSREVLAPRYPGRSEFAHRAELGNGTILLCSLGIDGNDRPSFQHSRCDLHDLIFAHAKDRLASHSGRKSPVRPRRLHPPGMERLRPSIGSGLS
jgi:hypothetical protein